MAAVPMGSAEGSVLQYARIRVVAVRTVLASLALTTKNGPLGLGFGHRIADFARVQFSSHNPLVLEMIKTEPSSPDRFIPVTLGMQLHWLRTRLRRSNKTLNRQLHPLSPLPSIQSSILPQLINPTTIRLQILHDPILMSPRGHLRLHLFLPLAPFALIPAYENQHHCAEDEPETGSDERD
ncbi:hypothetical protein K458DRAFT_424922 [Lentithecium fluviatile CBS 122367]|uniref:Uncharacterized protein n=1 Tax=Lentithecium fluviatile CBS 122367 TaxID=1168545 RepID=A0A6G1IDY3_9PLEO|nr:hypothetical protein K458DRAFT_424922 [Lentithecium fluviatile CBS 122367]